MYLKFGLKIFSISIILGTCYQIWSFWWIFSCLICTHSQTWNSPPKLYHSNEWIFCSTCIIWLRQKIASTKLQNRTEKKKKKGDEFIYYLRCTWRLVTIKVKEWAKERSIQKEESDYDIAMIWYVGLKLIVS